MDENKNFPNTFREFYSLIRGKNDTYFQYIYRYLSYPLVRLFYNLPVTPNHITLLGVLFWIVAYLFFFFDLGFWYDFVGFLLFFYSFVLDHCDGALARLKNMASLVGQYLDSFFDQIRNQLLYFLLAYRAWSVTGEVSFLYFYILFFIISTISHALDVQKFIIMLQNTSNYQSVESFFSKASLFSFCVNIYETFHSIILFTLAGALFMIRVFDYSSVKVFFFVYTASYLFKTIITFFVGLKQFSELDSK